MPLRDGRGAALSGYRLPVTTSLGPLRPAFRVATRRLL